ncbi:hypothetical protein C2E23DRAFT_887472 [Lenzites betulinus]|nr:hypothetical protein C2E23DRAFT_887472 [Lenzites betulinus]
MASFIAAATQFLTGTGNRSSWTTWRTSSPLPVEVRSRSDTGSRQLLEMRSQGLGLSIKFVDCVVSEHDGTPQLSAGSLPAGGLNLGSSPQMAYSGDTPPTCFSPDCDHSFCSPPRLMYSPASSSSIALDTPLPLTPSHPDCGNCADVTLLSPFGCHSPNNKQSRVLECATSAPRSTLAERRGAKALALKGTIIPPSALTLPRLSPTGSTNTPKFSPRIPSPRTPDSASSSFRQRLAGFMRPMTPTLTPSPYTPGLGSSSGTPRSPAGGRDYFEDPFGRAAPSFFDDSYFFDTAPARPHPDLFDLSIYAENADTAARARASWTHPPAPWTRMRTRVIGDGTDFFDLMCGPATPSERGDANSFSSGTESPVAGGSVHASFRSASASPSPDRPAAPVASRPPPGGANRLSLASLSAFFPSLNTSSPPPAPATAPASLPGPQIAPTTPQPNLRPLLLPQKFARREIADAQASSISILQHAAAPKLRVLVLPAELARRRASHPHRPFAFPRATLRPRPASCPARIAHSRSRKRACSLSALPGRDYDRMGMEGGTVADAVEGGDKRIGDKGRSGDVGTREEQRRPQQLDDILSLLDQSGVLVDHPDADADAEDAPESDSDDSTGVATPPSLLSRSGSSSSFSVVSQSGSYDGDVEAGTDEEETEKSRCDSRNLKDILELLDCQDDGAVSGPLADANVAERENGESVCAYAM